ncbi:hypothetical protein PAMP_020536 [Pampus punctatissimus]
MASGHCSLSTRPDKEKAGARRKQTITVSEISSQETSYALFSFPSSAPPQSPVIITGHRALARYPPPSRHRFYLHSLTLPPLVPMCVEEVSSSHRV